MPTIEQPIYKIGVVRISRDKKDGNFWLLRIPEHAIQAVNKSTQVSYGTSFKHNTDVTLWQVGGGTFLLNGTAIGIFIGTGVMG